MLLSSSDFSAAAAGTGSQVNFPSIISGFMMAEEGHEIPKVIHHKYYSTDLLQ